MAQSIVPKSVLTLLLMVTVPHAMESSESEEGLVSQDHLTYEVHEKRLTSTADSKARVSILFSCFYSSEMIQRYSSDQLKKFCETGSKVPEEIVILAKELVSDATKREIRCALKAVYESDVYYNDSDDSASDCDSKCTLF